MEKYNRTGFIYSIKNIITNKYYIGQTMVKNPATRWKDHIDDAFSKNSQYHLYKSIRKYGLTNFIFQILEENIPLELLDEREKYYIKYYDSYNNGYNNTEGGQDSSWHSKLKLEEVYEIIERIQDNENFSEIAKDYNVNPSTISDINNGDTWNFKELSYPIINKNNRKNFTEEEIQEIYSKLRKGESCASIAKKYGVSSTNICNINNGIIYNHGNEEYPIFKAVNSAKRLEVNKINLIIKELLSSSDSYTKIAERLNVGRKTVSNIDNGKGYIEIVKQLGYINFPIRKK